MITFQTWKSEYNNNLEIRIKKLNLLNLGLAAYLDRSMAQRLPCAKLKAGQPACKPRMEATTGGMPCRCITGRQASVARRVTRAVEPSGNQAANASERLQLGNSRTPVRDVHVVLVRFQIIIFWSKSAFPMIQVGSLLVLGCI